MRHSSSEFFPTDQRCPLGAMSIDGDTLIERAFRVKWLDGYHSGKLPR